MMTEIKDLDTSKNYDFDPITKTWVEQKTVDPMKEPHYTISEASKEAKVNPTTLNNAIRNGTLKAMQISDSSRWGYHYLIKESDLISWLDDESAHKRGNPNGWSTVNTKQKPVKKQKEKPIMDISKISEAIQKLIDAEVSKVTESYELKLKEIYDKGYSDGKEQAALDHEDNYQRGYRDGMTEGRNKAIDELSIALKEFKK